MVFLIRFLTYFQDVTEQKKKKHSSRINFNGTIENNY